MCTSSVRNQSGFTIMEVVIATGVGGLILLSAAGLFSMIGKANRQAAQAVAQMASSSIVGTNLPSLIVKARPSFDFIHMPVPKACDSSGVKPCLRMQTENGLVPLDSATAAKLSSSTYEFYRDHDGELKPGLSIAKRSANAGPASLTYTVPANLTKLGGNHMVFATWPLVDETSEPLQMMTWRGGVKFSVPGYTALSDAVPSSYLFLKTDMGFSDPTTMIGQPIVFFNAKDQRQYVVKLVTEAHSCGDSTWAPQCATSANGAGNVTSRDVLVKYGTIPGSEFDAFTGPIATVSGAGSWDSGYSDIKSFPNIATSVADSESMYFAGTSFDPRRLLHYFHGSGVSGDLVALPVALVEFKIVVNPDGRKDLVRDIFKSGSGAQRSIAVEEVKGSVVFTRKLGTQDFRMIIFDATEAGQNPYSKIVSSLSGSITDRTYTASTLDRRTITYPQDCEMTYTLTSFCGDGDVAQYYTEHPEEEYGKNASTYSLVLGYWVEPKSGTEARQVPTYENWFTIGYDHLELDTSHVGIQVAGSNRSVSSMQAIKAEMERVVSLASNLDDADEYRVFVSPMLCNDAWIGSTPADEMASHGSRSSGMLPEGAADTYGGQTCDESAMAVAKSLPPSLFTDTPPGAPGAPPGATPVPTPPPVTGCVSTCEYIYDPMFGSLCLPIDYCPVAAPTPAPTPVPTATPVPTPTPAPGDPSPDCTGSVYYVNSMNGGEPSSPTDCWSNTTFNPGVWDMYFSLPSTCTCNNYVPPTPTPTPTPDPMHTCSGAMPVYTPMCSGSVSCSEGGGHAYVYEDCGNGYDFWTATDGGAPQFTPVYTGF